MSNSDKDLNLDDEIDLTDELSVDELADESDFDDDDIFTPACSRKKSSKLLAGGVIILSLLAGAALYFYNKENAVSVLPIVAAVPEPTVSGVPGETEQAVVPKPVSDFETQTAPPQSENSIVLNQEAPIVSDQVKNPSEDNIDSPQSAPATDSLIPPLPDQQNASSQPEPEAVKAAEKNISKAEEIKIVEADKAPAPPAQDSLAPIQNSIEEKIEAKPKKKNELEAARETINLPKKAARNDVPETVYFDAPKGKALSDIPPPSINPELEPGQSIIIVHKGTSSGDGMIVEKGEDNGLIESRLVNANRAASLGSNDAALGFYNELYRKNPNDPRILMGRAVTLQKLGETQKAIYGYKEVLDIEPNNPEAITNLMGLIGKTQPAVALQNLLDLKERYPRNAAVAAQLGLAYAESGNPQDGLRELNSAANIQPENPLHYFNMAVIYDRLKDRNNAIKFYEQALDTYSVNGEPSSGGFSREQIYDRLAVLRGN